MYFIYRKCKLKIQVKTKKIKGKKMHREKKVTRLTLCENSLKIKIQIQIKILNQLNTQAQLEHGFKKLKEEGQCFFNT